MRTDSRYDQPREPPWGELSRGLKILAARASGVPVIAPLLAAQPPRSSSAPDKKPQLSDLRESGNLEAGLRTWWMFIYRERVLQRDSERPPARPT